MISAIPAAQINFVDPFTDPQAAPLQTGGTGLACANGYIQVPDATLAPSSSTVALAFPLGVTTAVVIYIAALTATDLIVKVGSGSPVSLPIPVGQGAFFYGITSANISLNSVLGGKIQYAVGG